MIMALPGQANGLSDGFGTCVPPSGDRMGSLFVVRWHRTGMGVDAEGTEPCAGLAIRMRGPMDGLIRARIIPNHRLPFGNT